MRGGWLVLLLVTGCAAESEVDWHGDKRFTAAERLSIEAGASWLAEHSGQRQPVIAWDYEVAGAEPLPKTIRREPGPDSSGACANGVLYLGLDEPGVRDVDVPGLAAHELAHCALGFVDDPQTGGIMHVVTPMQWTERESAQCHVTTACVP